MNSVDLSWVLAVEIALPFIVLTLVLALAIVSGRKKYKEAAKLLILSVKSSEDRDKQAIIAFLTEKLAIDESAAKKNAKKVMNERKFMIRNLVSGLLDKNVEAISQLNNDLSRITGHYHLLEASKLEPVDEKQEEDPEEQERTEELKAEIKGLKQEVHITLTTLNNIFKEFSSMFGEDDIPDAQMTVDQIITAMESFSGKSPNDDVYEFTDSDEQHEESEPNAETTADEQDSIDEPKEAEEEGEGEGEETEEVTESLEQQLEDNLDSSAVIETGTSEEEDEQLDFSIDSAIDDIDSALDGLELDASEEDEPDWGDAFAESGDKMEGDPK